MKALPAIATKTRGGRLLTVGILGVLSLCLSARVSLAATPGAGKGLPDELGTFNVGHTAFRIVGKGTLGENRPIDIDVWYPADQRSWDHASASVYTSRLYGVPLVPSKWDPLSWAVVSDVSKDEAEFDKHSPFPVVIFSHGSQNSPDEYALTIEYVASHGYVVAAAWYNGDTQDDVRVQFINTTNGSKVLSCLDNLPSPCVDTAAKNIADRARDLSAVLNVLPTVFGDNVNMDEVVAMGHSRGTVTSLGAASGSTFFNFPAEPRVKAVLGFANGAPALTFNLNLAAITVPTVLVAGDLDKASPEAISETAFTTISSQDKVLIEIKNTMHRHFATGFCPEMQASAAIVMANPTRAILDRHTLTGILTSPVNGNAVDICGFGYFSNPVDIRPLVFSLTGYSVTETNVPTTSIDTLEIRRLMSEIAVTFFDSVIKALRHEDQPCNDSVCSNARFNRYLSDKFLLKKESEISTAIIVTDEEMQRQLDCSDDCGD